MLYKIQKTIFLGFLIIFPVFCLNYFASPFDLPKIALLGGFTAILLFFLAIEVAIKGKISLKISNLDIPLLILSLSYLISGIVKTPNKMEAFFFPGNASIVILAFLIYFLGKRLFEDKGQTIATPLFFSGLLVSLLSILNFLGVFSLIPLLPSFLKDPIFSPVGGKLPEIIFLASIIPLGVVALIKEKETLKKILYGLSILIMVIGATIDISFVLPGKSFAPVLATASESWSVAIDSLKESPILGVGPGNYLSAYTKFLPLSHNSTPAWPIRFSSGSNFILTLITETGLLGLFAFGLTLVFLIKTILTKHRDASSISLLILLIFFFIFPVNVVLVTLFFLLLINVSKDKLVDLKIPKLTSSLLFFASTFLLFLIGRLFLGEVTYKKSLDAISKNDGKEAYNSLRKAITLNPYVDRYHATYSQVNLALAQSISQKTNITESEKETVAQLIQQAIREAKSTVTLNQTRSANWELLAKTYQTIIPFAQRADEFTVQTFSQAISLDPISPTLRIDLGKVYFALGRLDEAIAAFELAIASKPDLANAHYNLAITYGEKKEFDKAIDEINVVISLVAKDSSDYTLAQEALSNFVRKRSGVETEGSENLTPLQKLDPETETELNLPQEANPPNQN